MNPKDDPEARIRELERPLTERARSSEVAPQPYAETQPPTDGPWSPLPPAPPACTPARRPSSPVAWLVVAAVVLTLLVVGATAAIFFADAGPKRQGHPTVVGGGGPLDPT